MAKGYSARRGFSNSSGMSARQQDMQQQIVKMQEKMAQRQREIEAESFTASAGGGAVTATVSGKKELTSLVLQPETLDPDDVEMLQDLVISAVNKALRQADEAMETGMRALTDSLNLGGFGDLSGFGS